MWILDCEGDALQEKRFWLRSGKTYLFGRTKPDGGKHVGFAISHKSVSRQHLTITVTSPKPEDGDGGWLRSHLVLKDENTKVGTVIDGTKIRNESVTLQDNAHHFRLGSFEAQFRITWQPVVLSFTFPSKDTRGGKDPLVSVRSRLEELDIQVILPYNKDKTTHVVATKRNTAKCLQALVNGKYVVDHSFIDAIVYAATPNNLNEPESLSQLEEDFDKYWPQALEHVPAASKEATHRPAESFAPDPARQTVFEDYIFIFCDYRQYENLMPPITDGGGKALHYAIQHGSTTAPQIVSYFREVTNKKDDNDTARDGEENVILVRFTGEKQNESWATDVQTEVQNLLGLELIEQNEFLGAIVTNNPRKLIRDVTIPHADLSVTSQPDSVGDPQRYQSPASPLASSHLSRSRGVVRSVFKGFDDGFESFQLKSQQGAPEPSERSNPNPRKRSPPSDDDAQREDALLPAAAAMKRRRIQEGAAPRPQSRSAEPDALKSPPKPVKKEIDIVGTVRERRMAEDEAARNEELALQQSMSDMSFEGMNKLAKVEEMDVPERKPVVRSSAGTTDAADARWDSKWNGRKNFKKFRRQGDKQNLQRGQTVIVPLEEVQKRKQGIGEHYWLESTSSRRQKPRGSTEQGDRDEAVSPSHQTFASAHSHQEEEIPRELADLNDHQVIDVDEPRTTRQGRPAAASGTKRQAQTAKGGAAVKRQKTLTLRTGDESDSEDELKFRFRRRKAPSTQN